MGATPSTSNFGSAGSSCSEIADFQPIFARSASAVTSSGKSSINTNIGSPLRAFQWAQDEHRTLFISPQRGRKNAVSKILTISCDNSETVWLLITNRKSHTGFRVIPTSMTSNDHERRNSPYFAFFPPNWIALLANYVTVVENRPVSWLCLAFRIKSEWADKPLFVPWEMSTDSMSVSIKPQKFMSLPVYGGSRDIRGPSDSECCRHDKHVSGLPINHARGLCQNTWIHVYSDTLVAWWFCCSYAKHSGEIPKDEALNTELMWCENSVFTALHGMQTRSSDEQSVCPSACLSNTEYDSFAGRLCHPAVRSLCDSRASCSDNVFVTALDRTVAVIGLWNIHRVRKKRCHFIFCHNFVKS